MVKVVDEKKVKLDILATELERAKTQGPRGVSFDGMRLPQMQAVLQTCLAFNDEVPDFERAHLIGEAIFKAGDGAVITAASLLRAISESEKAYLRGTKRRLTVLTTVSLKHTRFLREVVWHGSTVRFYATRPRRFERVPTNSLVEWPAEQPAGYTNVGITVLARGSHEAYERAMDTLDHFRGVWNFSINRRVVTRFFSDKPRPINRIRRGPFHTVHEQTGRLAMQTYWYETVYDIRPPEDFAVEWPRIAKEARVVATWLRQHPYADDLHHAFVRYARALGSIDFDSAFLKLWGILEFLTHTTGGRYDETIRRTLFLFGETDVNRLILEHLRQYRNAMVHHGISRDEAETYTFQLKRYVETLLYFHLVWRRKFSSLAKVGEYLEHPLSVDDLRERYRLARQALRFRGA